MSVHDDPDDEQPEGMLVAHVCIEQRLDPETGNPNVYFRAVDDGGDPLPLVQTLGLLSLSTDTAIRLAMDPPEEDE